MSKDIDCYHDGIFTVAVTDSYQEGIFRKAVTCHDGYGQSKGREYYHDGIFTRAS
jgi:hypothetical protein